ncbi:hypothetical protein ACSS6W_010211 [Trichoderma asperelloides]
MALRLTISLLAFCSASLATTASHDSVRTLYEFPKPSYIENLAVRSNGQILISGLSTPQLFLFDPSATGPRKPLIVHEFDQSLGLAGIAEYQPDVFAVISGNTSFTTTVQVAGTWNVWSVDLRGVEIFTKNGQAQLSSPPVVKKIAHVKPAQFLNGLTVLSEPDQTLLRLDIETGNYEVVINNTFTELYPSPPFSASGVDGVHVRGNSAYFTNFGNGTFNKVPINRDGTPAGPVTTLGHSKGPLHQFDDFNFDCDGNAFVVTGGANTVEMISADGKRHVAIAGNLNSTAIAEPTSCAFGRGPHDKNILYVVTAGGMETPECSSAVVEVGLAIIRSSERGKGGENRKRDGCVSHHGEYFSQSDKNREMMLEYEESENGTRVWIDGSLIFLGGLAALNSSEFHMLRPRFLSVYQNTSIVRNGGSQILILKDSDLHSILFFVDE